MMVFGAATRAPRETPLSVVGRGLLAGLAGTFLLSVLARLLPGMGSTAVGQGGSEAERGKHLPPPRDRFDARQVREWQAGSQAPAAFAQARSSKPREAGTAAAAGSTPAGALTTPQAPGPEGAAEQFAFKIASGVFDRDISRSLRPAGLATHLVYGSLWGAVYGLLQASHHRRPTLFGLAYGLAVWLVGPGWLVPAMRLMLPPWEEPPVRTSTLVAGHLIYGVAVAKTFELLEREAT